MDQAFDNSNVQGHPLDVVVSIVRYYMIFKSVINIIDSVRWVKNCT